MEEYFADIAAVVTAADKEPAGTAAVAVADRELVDIAVVAVVDKPAFLPHGMLSLPACRITEYPHLFPW